MKLRKITVGSLGVIIFITLPIVTIVSCGSNNKNNLEIINEKLSLVNFSSDAKEYQTYVEKKLSNLFKTKKLKTQITSKQIQLVTNAANKITEESSIIKDKDIEEAEELARTCKITLNDNDIEEKNHINEVLEKSIATATQKYNKTIINKISEVANQLEAWDKEVLATKVNKSLLKSMIDRTKNVEEVNLIFYGEYGYTKTIRSIPFTAKDIKTIIEAAQNISEPSSKDKKAELLANKFKAAKDAAKKFIDNNEIFGRNYIPPYKFIFKPIFTLQEYKDELVKILGELKLYNLKFKNELRQIWKRFKDSKSKDEALEVAKEEARIRFLSQ